MPPFFQRPPPVGRNQCPPLDPWEKKLVCAFQGQTKPTDTTVWSRASGERIQETIVEMPRQPFASEATLRGLER